LKLYELVGAFLAVFFPAAEYLVTTRITEVKTHSFKTDGRIRSNRAGSPCTGGSPGMGRSHWCRSSPTKRSRRSIEATPADASGPRYTGGTLLSAMEGRGQTAR